MSPVEIDIVKAAEIIGACSVILGAIIGGYKLYDKLIDSNIVCLPVNISKAENIYERNFQIEIHKK